MGQIQAWHSKSITVIASQSTFQITTIAQRVIFAASSLLSAAGQSCVSTALQHRRSPAAALQPCKPGNQNQAVRTCSLRCRRTQLLSSIKVNLCATSRAFIRAHKNQRHQALRITHGRHPCLQGCHSSVHSRAPNSIHPLLPAASCAHTHCSPAVVSASAACKRAPASLRLPVKASG